MVFPELPVLASIRQRASKEVKHKVEQTLFVCVQHVLSTTGSLIETLLQVGARPENVYLLGKLYSTHHRTAQRLADDLGVHYVSSTEPKKFGIYDQCMERDVERLWDGVAHDMSRKSVQSIVVLDDGGQCLRQVPDAISEQIPVAGIEQTTRGLEEQDHFGQLPVVQVASSAIKRHIEPPLIREAILEKLEVVLPVFGTTQRCGVVGLGNIGAAVARYLLDQGFTVLGHDLVTERVEAVEGISACASNAEVFSEARVIFGCTGSDLSEDVLAKGVSGKVTLVSCSSSDIEYKALLRKYSSSQNGSMPNPLHNFTFSVPQRDLQTEFVRGGFPVNFDGSAESVPASKIQVTRGLLLIALLQASLMTSKANGVKEAVMLNPDLQRFVANEWFQDQPECRGIYPSDVFSGLTGSLSWIEKESGGRSLTFQGRNRFLR
jgi:S-adenosylhomocysteine hydrolase